jgi:hypothetical protein
LPIKADCDTLRAGERNQSALSEFPDKKWYYHTLRDNTESKALANALGFTLEGAELYLP